MVPDPAALGENPNIAAGGYMTAVPPARPPPKPIAKCKRGREAIHSRIRVELMFQETG